MLSVWLAMLWALDPASAGPRETAAVVATEDARDAVAAVSTRGASRRGRGIVTGSGSAVLVDVGGLMLTNAHVVDGAMDIVVDFPTGERKVARVLASLQDLDLAVLQVDPARLPPPIAIGLSSDLRPAEPAIAIGNPFGFGQSVSVGVVSHIGRVVEVRPGLQRTYIQTDATINPGNSGGALINADGELIGINTARYSLGEGIGFAIPIDRALKVLEDIRDSGRVDSPWLGLELADLTLRAHLRSSPLTACRVTAVHEGGPGADAGLRVGDILITVADQAVLSRADVNAVLAGQRPGDSIALRVLRQDTDVRIELSGGAAPADIRRHAELRLGATFDVSAGSVGLRDLARRGPAATAGLEPGDTLIAIDGTTVATATDLDAALVEAVASHRPWMTMSVRRRRVMMHRAVWF